MGAKRRNFRVMDMRTGVTYNGIIRAVSAEQAAHLYARSSLCNEDLCIFLEAREVDLETHTDADIPHSCPTCGFSEPHVDYNEQPCPNCGD